MLSSLQVEALPLRGTSRRLVRVGLASLALLAVACGASPGEPSGKSLVILPYEGPLGRKVTTRDPRLSYHDFGRVPDGETVTRVFQLRNEDPREVSILRVDPSCGCTVASLRAVRKDGTVERGESIRSKAEKLLTVAPGELVEIEVRVSTRDMSTKNMDKLLNLRVITDSPNGYFLTLELHILVEQAFAVVPATLALGSIPENGGGDGKVQIAQTGYFYYDVKELYPLPEGVHAELSREDRSGTPLWNVVAGFDPPLARGSRTATLRLATEESSGVPGPDIEVPMTALVVGDFLANPDRIVFAATSAGVHRSSTEFGSLLAGHRLRLTGVEVPEAQRAWLTAAFEPLAPDDAGSSLRWLLTLETVPPLPEQEMLTGKLRLHLDDPQHPTYEVEYVVHVR